VLFSFTDKSPQTVIDKSVFFLQIEERCIYLPEELDLVDFADFMRTILICF
jgi:hypothetical protein